MIIYSISSSTSSSDGSVSINATFEQGTDPDTAQVQVQNKIQQAESRLPSEVQQTGVTVEKSQSNFLLIAAVYDTTDKASSSDIADWLVSNCSGIRWRVLKVWGVCKSLARNTLCASGLTGQTGVLLANAFRRAKCY
ncbi:efflux RND transporter permease subunit [Escherichia coli]|nr:efflux RND transporter permease subunit [Escherichia coli]